MPELPEVETVCRSLRPHLLGRRIERIDVRERRLRVPVDVARVGLLAGKRIESVDRVAKYILLRFSNGAVWLFHLGMSGTILPPRTRHARGTTISLSI